MVKKVVEITEKTPVTTLISDPGIIKDFLSYKYEWWKQGQYRKEKMSARKSLVHGGAFFSGYQKRVQEYLDRRGIEWTFKEPNYRISVNYYGLKGITFRGDQEEALEQMITARRGVWQAPTGSGKTLLICGLVAAFQTTALILVHTEQLFQQTQEELHRFFPKSSVGKIGRGEWKPKLITVGMIQTISRKKELGMEWKTQWGMVIIDECHHLSSIEGSYAHVLKQTLAPIRFGFMATPPQTEMARMALEGLIGPPIGRTTYAELQENDVLAKPKLKFIKMPDTDRYKDMKGSYALVYKVGVVNNRLRNGMVIDEAVRLISEGRTVLVLVERIEHGHELMKMAQAQTPNTFVFLNGQTPAEDRAKEKQVFSDRVRKGVIATRIWNEGVNIKSIGAVINAVGGESEIASIQRFGRGLRKTDGKEDVVLVDFIDVNHKYFSKHSMTRICTYSDWGWL